MIKTFLVGCAALAMAHSAYAADGDAQTAICRIVAERFAALPGDALERTPLSELSQSSGSGISKHQAIERDEGPRSLLAWAAAQTPPVELPQVLTDEEFDSSSLAQLPGTAFYALHSVGGTAHCYSSMYFEVRSDGEAQIAAEPPGFADGACMVTRSFGTIDRTPVLFQESYTLGPEMRSTLTVAHRDSEGFWAACRVTFEYEPVFSDGASNAGDAHCAGADCTRLQSAAQEIAAAVQSDPRRARLALLARLTPSQQRAYEKAEEAMLARAPGVTPEQATNAEQITEEFPFRLPYTDGERLYIASVGHVTIGWRYFADWSVTFHEVAQNTLTESGSFAVGMSKGGVKRTLLEAL